MPDVAEAVLTKCITHNHAKEDHRTYQVLHFIVC